MLDLVFSLIGFSLFSNDMNNLLEVVHICLFFEGRCPEGFIFFLDAKETLSLSLTHIEKVWHRKGSRCSQK